MTRIDRRTFLAGAAGSAAALALPAATRAQAPAAIAARLAEAGRAELGVTALAIGVLTPEGMHVAGAGDAGRGAPPDGATVFPLESVTKTFTALTLARFAATGRVALDDPVQRHLPEGLALPAGAAKRITLEQLATQTSGLPRLPAGVAELPGFDARDPYAVLTDDALADALPRTRLLGAPGKRFRYSNLGMGLLGIALAHARGAGYGRTVREAVSAPLGLDDVVLAPGREQAARTAIGHDAQGDPAPHWTFGALPGAGGLYGTATDLLRYLRAHLRLRPAGMAAELRTVRVSRERVDERTRIGLAWFRSRAPRVGPFAWHNGLSGVASSFAGFAPGTGLGVVALANGPAPVDRVGVAALRALAGTR